jgi:hypothetical protein
VAGREKRPAPAQLQSLQSVRHTDPIAGATLVSRPAYAAGAPARPSIDRKDRAGVALQRHQEPDGGYRMEQSTDLRRDKRAAATEGSGADENCSVCSGQSGIARDILPKVQGQFGEQDRLPRVSCRGRVLKTQDYLQPR